MSALSIPARVTGIEDFKDARLRRIMLTPEAGHALPPYEAGQYAMLSFPGFEPRPFSIGNAPGSPHLEFHIRDSGTGFSSHAATQLKEGDRLILQAPFGHCRFIRDCDRPALAVAGGSGLSCMKAIIEAALGDAQRQSPLTLYVGARRREDLYLDAPFRDLADKDGRFTYVPVLSDSAADGFRHGLVADAMAQDHPDLSTFRIYGAGPVDMMRHLTDLAVAGGAQKAHIHTDLHTTSAKPG